MQLKKNVVVGQSGGPTSVINSSLAGVFNASDILKAPKIYGMRYGIQGLLDENLIDLRDIIRDDIDLELLKRTPSSYLGSCRYKLPDIDKDDKLYQKIFSILESFNIGYFFYIGGNDSMDTIKKLSDYARRINSDIRFIGVPKTIDNDLVATDHTPGYASAAKYIATVVKEIVQDALVYDMESVTVIEIMGRNAGWLTAAAALSRGDDCKGVDMIYLPETEFDIEKFLNNIKNKMKSKKSIVIAVSEGIRTKEGKYICELGAACSDKDAFGHSKLSGTAGYLSELISTEIGCKSRGIELNTPQRCASHLVSKTDIDEAFLVGYKAVEAAALNETGKMVALERVSTTPYLCSTGLYDLNRIANEVRKVPREWINENGDYVTQEFIDYLTPLIDGELLPIISNGIPKHLRLLE